MLTKVSACFVLLVALASAQTEQDRLRHAQICPDGSFPRICITYPCVPCPPTKNVCSLPADSGPCEAAIPRWFFNTRTRRCERFTYGGCKGNQNNFTSQKACEVRCHSIVKPPPTTKPPPTNTNVCQLPKVIGPCDGAFPRYYFNPASRRCEKFSFGGCGGNKNNFETLSACQRSCGGTGPTDICKLSAETGRCRAAIPRWFFNSLTGQCEQFTYGGCGGNENNFKTIEACKERCGGGGGPIICNFVQGARCSTDAQCCGGKCCRPVENTSITGICTPKNACFLRG